MVSKGGRWQMGPEILFKPWHHFQCTCSLANWDLGGLHSNSNSCQFPSEVNYPNCLYTTLCHLFTKIICKHKESCLQRFWSILDSTWGQLLLPPTPAPSNPPLAIEDGNPARDPARFWPLKMGTPMVLMVKPHWYQ